jgi:hypothetical protein
LYYEKVLWATTCIINALLLLQFKFISLNIRFATTENPADSKSHKSYTNQLGAIKKHSK